MLRTLRIECKILIYVGLAMVLNQNKGKENEKKKETGRQSFEIKGRRNFYMHLNQTLVWLACEEASV